MASTIDKSNPRVPLASLTDDRGYKDGLATSTCLCGAVQLAFPTEGPGLGVTFICNCCDCRKIHASMFASNFIVDDAHLKHIRGQEGLKSFGQARTVASGNTMTNYFCDTCGGLMYRVSSGLPGKTILRFGPVDDLNLHDALLKPAVEQWTKYRVSWLKPLEGVKQTEGEGATL